MIQNLHDIFHLYERKIGYLNKYQANVMLNKRLIKAENSLQISIRFRILLLYFIGFWIKMIKDYYLKYTAENVPSSSSYNKNYSGLIILDHETST